MRKSVDFMDKKVPVSLSLTLKTVASLDKIRPASCYPVSEYISHLIDLEVERRAFIEKHDLIKKAKQDMSPVEFIMFLLKKEAHKPISYNFSEFMENNVVELEPPVKEIPIDIGGK